MDAVVPAGAIFTLVLEEFTIPWPHAGRFIR